MVINNQLEDNGLPGVAMHNHVAPPGAPPVNLNDNLIVGNRISGNGKDTEDAATPGPTGINVFGVCSITGTVISGNVIDDEAVDIATNTPAQVNVHLNDLLGGIRPSAWITSAPAQTPQSTPRRTGGLPPRPW